MESMIETRNPGRRHIRHDRKRTSFKRTLC